MHRRCGDLPISKIQERPGPFQIIFPELLVDDCIRSGFRRQIAYHRVQDRQNLGARIDRYQRQVFLTRRPRQAADKQFQFPKSRQQLWHAPDDPRQARICEIREIDRHCGETGTCGGTAIVVIDDDIPEPAILLHAGLDRSDEAWIHENRSTGLGTNALPSGQVNFTDRIEDAIRKWHSSVSSRKYITKADSLIPVS